MMNFHVARCMQGSKEDLHDGQRRGQIFAGTDDTNVPRNKKPYCSTVLHFPVEIGYYISTQIPADMILSLSWEEVRTGVLSRELG